MSTVECCLECAFFAWDRRREQFICIKTLRPRVVSPSHPACANAYPHTHRKSRDRSLAYQLDLFTERR